MAGAAEEPIVELNVDPEAHGLKFSSVRIGWQEALAQIVANAHLCRLLVTKGTNYVTFVGTKPHATVAEYAYGVLAASADKMSKEARDDYWREHRNDPDFQSGNFRAAWLDGFINRIGERFAEARRAEVAAAVSSSTALMRLEGAHVRASSYVDDKYKRKVQSAQRSTGCVEGRLAGRRAADDVALDRRGVGSNAAKHLGGGTR